MKQTIASQPWVSKPLLDIIFILFPPFACLLIIAIFPGLFQNEKGIPDASWVILILLIDVAHVYSTLYRTYFDRSALKQQRSLLIGIPIAGFIAGVLLYSFSPMAFWRLLAYVAVFHFIRQQYGFMRLYSRKETYSRHSKLIDSIAIYSATLYPILYWHLAGPRNFSWFIEGDFVFTEATVIAQLLELIYFAVMGLWLLKELMVSIRGKYFNVPKFFIVTGTAVSWYAGIVYFNGDLAFTLLNVVSHGIPYMALVWVYGRNNYYKKEGASRRLKFLFSGFGIIAFVGILFVLAFIEEGLWDLAVWREHGHLFGTAVDVSVPEVLLAFIVPLLALPQITHYILDGFIWKIRKEKF